MLMVPAVTLAVVAGASGVLAAAFNHPDYAPVSGMTARELKIYECSIKVVGSQPRPVPITDTSFKLVYDKAHPFVKQRAGDQRGPCPGLNTLASHGYLPHTGVATPAQIINATIEGFNMDYELAAIVTYGAFLVNGNHLTNLMSIGGLSGLTGPPPKPPALAGGLNVHGTFEGDASLTRSDDFLGNNHDLNMTLFNQLIDTMDTFGGGNYNLTAAAEFRWIRIQDSIARNPTFDFGNPRFSTAYAESSFPLAFFSNLSEPDLAIGTSAANIRSFFLEHKFPENFHRRGTPFDAGGDIIADLQIAHPISPGKNDGVNANTYHEVDFLEGETDIGCAIYHKFVNKTVALYPNPKGALRKAINGNLNNLYQSTGGVGGVCTQLFPYN